MMSPYSGSIGLTGDERRREQEREASRRTRLRAKGIDVPRKPPGPPKGYKFDPAVVAARNVPRGEAHSAWLGDRVSERGGRTRALRMYREIGPCKRCGADIAERHHADGNTANNAPSNIEALCRRCHMEADGRLEQFRDLARANGRKQGAR